MSVWGIKFLFSFHCCLYSVLYIVELSKNSSSKNLHLAILSTVVVVQSLSCVWLFVTPWSAAHQASLSFTISGRLHKLLSIESVMPSNHSVFSFLQSFPASGSFPMSWLYSSGGQSNGASASVSVISMNIQDWFDLLTVQGTRKSLLHHHSFSNVIHYYYHESQLVGWLIWGGGAFYNLLNKSKPFSGTCVSAQ